MVEASAPAPAVQGEQPVTVDIILDIAGLLAGMVVFISLLGVDTLKALRRRALWIPGDALVLSALTIQVMNLLNSQNTFFKQVLENPGGEQWNGEVVKNYLFYMHCGRVMLCVLVAYFLPGMARPGYEDSWGKLAALGLSIFLHISSEMLTVNRHLGQAGKIPTRTYSFYFWPHANHVSEVSFIVSAVIITMSLVCLILLLSSATIANKSIRNIITQRIPSILAAQSHAANQNSREAVERHVLKSWVVLCGCYPETVIAKSVLSSSAAFVVTVCILCSILGWIFQGPVVKTFGSAAFWSEFTATVLQVVFILIGWAVIGWRWFTSVVYYGRWRTKKENWRAYLRVEDFWTRYIVDFKEAGGSRVRHRPLHEKVGKMVATESIELYLPKTLLPCVFWAQYFLVYFSKVCLLLSDLVLQNGFMRRLSSNILSNHFRKVESDIRQYKPIVKDVHVLGENPESLLVANRKSIRQAKELMIHGHGDGEKCADLVKFLTEKMSAGCVGIKCLDAGRGRGETGLKFLCKRDPGPALNVEERFIYLTKRSWKLTALSLINIITRLSRADGESSLKAYSQAYEFVDLVDESDQESDSLLSKAADGLFESLRSVRAEPTMIASMQQAVKEIDKLAKEGKDQAEVIENAEDSVDWKKVAAGNWSYKLCKSIDCTSGEFGELLNELQSSLADILGVCIQRVGPTLVESCSKWAVDLQERKLVEAVYTVGKWQGLMEELDKRGLSMTGTATNAESSMV